MNFTMEYLWLFMANFLDDPTATIFRLCDRSWVSNWMTDSIVKSLNINTERNESKSSEEDISWDFKCMLEFEKCDLQ